MIGLLEAFAVCSLDGQLTNGSRAIMGLTSLKKLESVLIEHGYNGPHMDTLEPL